jgi:exodeoxyribonuclease VII small subunit
LQIADFQIFLSPIPNRQIAIIRTLFLNPQSEIGNPQSGGGFVAEQKFEDAFQKLESIVKKLEDGKLSLEESLKAFEEGVRLSRLCSKKLDEAEKKVEILLKDSDGRLVPKPFSLEEEGD